MSQVLTYQVVAYFAQVGSLRLLVYKASHEQPAGQHADKPTTGGYDRSAA